MEEREKVTCCGEPCQKRWTSPGRGQQCLARGQGCGASREWP